MKHHQTLVNFAVEKIGIHEDRVDDYLDELITWRENGFWPVMNATKFAKKYGMNRTRSENKNFWLMMRLVNLTKAY